MKRGLLVWFLIMLVETVHGILRGAWLAPLVGADAAARIGWPVAAMLVMIIAALTVRWAALRDRSALLGLGAIWAVLTTLFELLVGALRGLDAPTLLSALNPFTGSIAWTAAVMLVAPLVAARLRGLV